MGRAILAVVAGLIAMWALVMASMFAVYSFMGANQAFLPGKYEASLRWIAATSALGMFAAIVGGWVCAKIARTRTPIYVLIGLVVVMGVITGLTEMNKSISTEPRTTGDISFMEAAKVAHTPTWVLVVNPILAVAGIVLGSLVVRPRPAGAPPA